MDEVHGSSVVTVTGIIIVVIQDDLDDRSVLALQDRLVEQVARSKARGVIIDISALEVVDTFAGRMLSNMADMSRILNARTIVVGMRPAVAMTLVELGLSLDGVDTALSADKAMAILKDAENRGRDR